MSKRRLKNDALHRQGYQACSLAVLLSIAGLGGALAEEPRSASAHQHGAAQLSIAEDGDVISMEFISPAINLIGFEHAARDESERRKVQDAVSLLEDGAKLFRFEGRVCELESVAVIAAGLVPDADVADGRSDEHGDDHSDEHGDEHEEGHSDEHEDEAGTHSEFEGRYAFKCAAGGTLLSIRVGFFDKWTNLEDVDTVFIGAGKQLSAELTAWTPTLEIED